MYMLARNIHITAAIVSVAGFVLRGVWMLTASPMLERKIVRILPHIIDTVLLASAIWLSVLMAQYPFVAGWLTAKFLALIAYIVLGVIALRRGRTRGQRMTAFILALVVVGYIFLVAVSKQAIPL